MGASARKTMLIVRNRENTNRSQLLTARVIQFPFERRDGQSDLLYKVEA